MLLVQEFLEAIVAAMIADTGWLHSAAGSPLASTLGLALITQPFTPARSTTLGDLTLNDGGNVTPDVAMLGNYIQNEVTDGVGNPGLQLVEPLGGFTYTVTALDPAPVDVYGVALVRMDDGLPIGLLATASIEPTRMQLTGQTLQVSSILGFFDGLVFADATAVITTAGPIPTP